jgi:hypothetical protein
MGHLYSPPPRGTCRGRRMRTRSWRGVAVQVAFEKVKACENQGFQYALQKQAFLSSTDGDSICFMGSRVESRRFQAMGKNWIELVQRPAEGHKGGPIGDAAVSGPRLAVPGRHHRHLAEEKHDGERQRGHGGDDHPPGCSGTSCI